MSMRNGFWRVGAALVASALTGASGGAAPVTTASVPTVGAPVLVDFEDISYMRWRRSYRLNEDESAGFRARCRAMILEGLKAEGPFTEARRASGSYRVMVAARNLWINQKALEQAKTSSLAEVTLAAEVLDPATGDKIADVSHHYTNEFGTLYHVTVEAYWKAGDITCTNFGGRIGKALAAEIGGGSP